MHFELLENFEWYNEPENVRFEGEGMVIYAKEGGDFWQSVHRGFKKDDGHFFFCRQEGDFFLTLKWRFDKLDKFSQCGIMLRIDERNWFKASIMNENAGYDVLASSLTVGGHSDWSGFSLGQDVNEIWFRLNRVQDDYILSYSLDGIKFIKVRMFYLKSYEEVKAGAYIASPNKADFYAELSGLKLGA